MNKKDLLARVAKQNGMHPVALALASSDISEDFATSRAKILGRRAGRLSKAVKLTLPALAAASLAVVYCCAPDSPGADAVFYERHVIPVVRGAYAWFILMVTSGLLVGGVKLAGIEWLANPDEQRYLEPVAGTPKELDVASLLENGGPTVAAWRDVALREHGRLYGFDFEIMRSLTQLHAAEQREAAKKAELLAPAPPAPVTHAA